MLTLSPTAPHCRIKRYASVCRFLLNLTVFSLWDISNVIIRDIWETPWKTTEDIIQLFPQSAVVGHV